MKILVTICARGGSKGVKNKNIRMVAGKPLIQHTIDLAKQWKNAGKIVCSTDSGDILKIAKDCGIDVPFIRPPELSDDGAGKVDVIRHALKQCELLYDMNFDLVVDLDVTNPLRTVSDLDNCFEIFLAKHPDVLFSVVEAHRNPYFNMVEIDESGSVKLCKSYSEQFSRRQDAPKVYDLNASIYFYDRNFLIDPANTSIFSTKKIEVYVMDGYSGVDIDTELDLNYVDFLMRTRSLE